MKAVMNELEKNDDIILFIDEIHYCWRWWSHWFPRCIQYVQTGFSRGDQCNTTLDEYRQYIEKMVL
jgi:ATP-dependent Clp protease ATP-binding subunit ClpC